MSKVSSYSALDIGMKFDSVIVLIMIALTKHECESPLDLDRFTYRTESQ
jgi:hypothetical protein